MATPSRGRRRRPHAPDSKTSPDDEKKAPEYKLLRFFDFNVEPGKQYVYRVRLALLNPNHSVKPAVLKNPDLAKQQPYLITKWSDPSNSVSVPYDTRVLAVAVKPAVHNKEPSCQILVVKWVQQTGLVVPREFSVVRASRQFLRQRGKTCRWGQRKHR